MATNNSINSRELIKTNNLSDLANAGTARTNLGLGTAAVVATDLADLNEATIESAIDTLANLTSIQGRTVTLADAGANAVFGWDDVAGAYENLTASEVRGAIGLATSDSPQFTGIELGHASDTTLARVSAGVVSIEGVTVATATNTLTLSGKTLTEPKFADLGFIADANGNELLIFDTVTSAVNEITFANAATGGNPNFTASGGDANVGIDFTPKGTGFIQIKGNSTQAGTLAIYEDTDDGSNYSAFRGSARSGNIIYTMPTADPTAGQVLSAGAPSGGVSALSWSTPSSGGAPYTLLITDFASSGRFSQSTGSSGANTFGTHGVRISTGTAGNSHADVQWFITPQTQGRIWDDSPEFSCSISIRNAPNSGSNNGRAYIGLGALINSGGTSIDFTGKHVGFKLLQTSADTYTLYATQGDGSTETASSALTTVDDTPTSLELCLKINALSSVDYYWRKDAGAWSSATNLTTNLPTTGDGARAAQFIIIDEASSFNNEIEISGASYKR